MVKVFFSYGRRRGAEFVERLYQALLAKGYACWKDSHQIEPGKDWRERIWDGLSDTAQTLAFLSAHALREASPCLDEHRIARHYNAPITPIFLERVDVPGRIDRRNAIDMTEWAARGDDPAWFAAQVAAIEAVLNDADLVQQAALMRDLQKWLLPSLHETELPPLLNGFVGRGWLRDKVEHWRRDMRAHRMFCITGSPGAGKSAFAAWLAHEHRGTVIALNLCRPEAKRREPGSVIRTLAYLIAAELPDFRSALHAALADEAVRTARLNETSGALMQTLLLGPLRALVNGRHPERLLLVIDSLDESLSGGRSALLDLLLEKAAEWPDWVAIMVTSRREPLLAAALDGLPGLHLDEQAGHADDIAVYARGWLGQRPEAEREDAIRRVVTAADGNMLAMRLLHLAIGEGKIDLALPLPQGLSAILLRFMRRQFPLENEADRKAYAQDVQWVIDVRAAAGQPVPLAVLRDMGGWTARTERRVIERLGSLFPVREDAVGVWHPYLLEFLTGALAPSDYLVDAEAGRRALRDYLWTVPLLSAPDDFTADVVPRLVGPQRPTELARDRAAPEARPLLVAIADGAATLERFPNWDRALAWWRALAIMAGENHRDIAASADGMQGDIHLHRGNQAAALAAYQAYRGHAERLVASDPGNAGWQRDLSVSHDRIGTVLRAQGDLDAALLAYRDSMAIAERLAASDPGNAEWQRDLSISHSKIGDVLRAQGDLDAALLAYRASMAIHERLAASDPGNAEWQRDLSISHSKIGDVLRAQGDLDAALLAYRASMAIAELLATSDPGNAEWQRDLSVGHERIGTVLQAQGDLDAALLAYRDSMAIRERLTASDPGNAEWQRDLSVSHNKIGDVLRAQGDLDAALLAYRDSMAIRERLTASDPGNAGWQHDLSVSHDRIGDVLQAQGDLDAALLAYRDSMAIAERLAASDPGNAEWQRDLSVSHNRIGDVLRAQGDLDAALLAYRASMTIAGRLAASHPGNAGWQRDLSVSHNKIGDVLQAQGDLDAALLAYRASMTIAGRLAASDPGNAEWQRDLSVSHNRIGDVLRAQGDLDAALLAYRASMTIAGRLAASHPGNAGWQRDLFVSLYRLTVVLLETGAKEAACAMARRLAAQANLLASRFPQDRQRESYVRVAQDLYQAACGGGA